MAVEKAFCLWSGGKDSSFALYKAQRNGVLVSRLITLLDENGSGSRSHGLTRHNLQAQAKSLGLEIRFAPTSRGTLARVFDELVGDAVSHGCEFGIFGDIYVWEHRAWIEERAAQLGFTPLFPLWGANALKLCEELLELKFKALIVAVKKGSLGSDWLGKTLDRKTMDELLETDIDPCGENGEYHTFVYDGPIFDNCISFTCGNIWDNRWYHFLEIMT